MPSSHLSGDDLAPSTQTHGTDSLLCISTGKVDGTSDPMQSILSPQPAPQQPFPGPLMATIAGANPWTRPGRSLPVSCRACH